MVATTEPMQRVRQLPTKVFHFLMWFSDLTPLHMVLIIHRLLLKEPLTSPALYRLTSDVRCYRSSQPLLNPLRRLNRCNAHAL